MSGRNPRRTENMRRTGRVSRERPPASDVCVRDSKTSRLQNTASTQPSRSRRRTLGNCPPHTALDNLLCQVCRTTDPCCIPRNTRQTVSTRRDTAGKSPASARRCTGSLCQPRQMRLSISSCTRRICSPLDNCKKENRMILTCCRPHLYSQCPRTASKL